MSRLALLRNAGGVGLWSAASRTHTWQVTNGSQENFRRSSDAYPGTRMTGTFTETVKVDDEALPLEDYNIYGPGATISGIPQSVVLAGSGLYIRMDFGGSGGEHPVRSLDAGDASLVIFNAGKTFFRGSFVASWLHSGDLRALFHHDGEPAIADVLNGSAAPGAAYQIDLILS
jgi:hypothetical protein